MSFFKNFEPRLYQQTIFASALNKNTLVVLPTGLGKTAISMLLVVNRLKKYPKSKVLILAPTRPLVNQHYDSFVEKIDMNFLHPDNMVVFTGQIKAEKRAELWNDSRVIFSTPQGLENDVLTSKIKLEEVSLIVFDEAHRATGDYSYVWLAFQYKKQAKNSLILALTASPGGDTDSIREVIDKLYIQNIEIRDKNSPDVKPYVKETNLKWVEIELPVEFKEILNPLKEMVKIRVKLILKYLIQINPRLKINPNYVSKKDLLILQGKLQGMIRENPDPEIYSAISIAAQIIKLQHAIELLETQGVGAARIYMDGIYKDGKNKTSKSVQNIINDVNFRIAISKIWKLEDSSINHPKLKKLSEIVLRQLKKKKDSKIIIFNNYRDSIKNLKKMFDNYDDVKSAIFVGQAKKKGMGITQKKQIQLIKEFREGTYNVMLMSSVGEEGLDIPAVDLVVFYEPVPSAIRQIQRAGRTGRNEKGEVIILVAKDTKDIAYFWATKNKQKKMYSVLENIKKEIEEKIFFESASEQHLSNNQITLNDSIQTPINKKNNKISEKEQKKTIIVDTREKSNRIVKQLVDKGFKIKLEQLITGDYILNDKVGIEFKTQKDFIDSIIDGRLFSQASRLNRAFSNPLIIVQGEDDIYSIRNIHPNAIIGAISTLSFSFRIPIIFTKNAEDTAYLFTTIAERQEQKLKYNPHALKPKLIQEEQEFIVASIPGIGKKLSKKLLETFGNITNIINASETELEKIIGKSKSRKMKEIFNLRYSKEGFK